MALQVKDLMDQEYVETSPDEGLRPVLKRMWERGVGNAVVTEGGQRKGIITEYDAVQFFAEEVDVDNTTVGEVMSGDLITTEPDTPVADAVGMMVEEHIRRLPVESDGEMKGIFVLVDADVIRELTTESFELP